MLWLSTIVRTYCLPCWRQQGCRVYLVRNTSVATFRGTHFTYRSATRTTPYPLWNQTPQFSKLSLHHHFVGSVLSPVIHRCTLTSFNVTRIRVLVTPDWLILIVNTACSLDTRLYNYFNYLIILWPVTQNSTTFLPNFFASVSIAFAVIFLLVVMCNTVKPVIYGHCFM